MSPAPRRLFQARARSAISHLQQTFELPCATDVQPLIESPTRPHPWPFTKTVELPEAMMHYGSGKELAAGTEAAYGPVLSVALARDADAVHETRCRSRPRGKERASNGIHVGIADPTDCGHQRRHLASATSWSMLLNVAM